MACNTDNKRFLKISGCSSAAPFKKNQKIKKVKASSESYVDAVVSAENVVGYATGRW